jgi:hypothetical protein
MRRYGGPNTRAVISRDLEKKRDRKGDSGGGDGDSGDREASRVGTADDE